MFDISLICETVVDWVAALRKRHRMPDWMNGNIGIYSMVHEILKTTQILKNALTSLCPIMMNKKKRTQQNSRTLIQFPIDAIMWYRAENPQRRTQIQGGADQSIPLRESFWFEIFQSIPCKCK